MDKIRAKIDAIDDAMRILFEQRMDCVQEVIDYKFKNKMAIKDSHREAAMIERNTRKLKNQKYKAAYEYFLREMMASSREFQQTYLNEKNDNKRG